MLRPTHPDVIRNTDAFLRKLWRLRLHSTKRRPQTHLSILIARGLDAVETSAGSHLHLHFWVVESPMTDSAESGGLGHMTRYFHMP